ncbi:MAG TPA: flippase-like domain-containing protein, partial [Candidatus Pelethocola excrementipullorum]|nr:flippase-like domain-containing protein [Candidatus Pelethocola excrementipullorum]
MNPTFKKYKTPLKWMLVLTALFMVCFYNREQIPLIAEQIRETPKILLMISTLLALAYFICEGRIIAMLGNRYQPSFTIGHGISAAFFCEFYRLLTLGSMTGVAEIYYLHTNKIPAAKGTGMCLVQYLIQRMSIAVLGLASCVIVLIRYPNVVQAHSWQIILSYLITILVLCGLIFVGTCKKATTWLFCLVERKAGQRLKGLLGKAHEQVNILQSEVQLLLKERQIMFRLLVQNIVKMLCWFSIPAILLFNPENPASFLSNMALTS